LHWQMPESVVGRILSQSENLPGRSSAPIEFAATLFYPGGMTVEFYSSFLAAIQQWVYVSGQKGRLRVPDFIHPFDSYEPSFEVNEKMITVAGEVKCPSGSDPAVQGHSTAQDAHMWRNFANQIASGKLNDEWPRWSLQTQKVLDACHESAKQNRALKLSP